MALRFFEDTVAAQSHIEEMIGKFGWAAEHNYYWYQYYQHYYNPPQRNVFVENDFGALFTAYDEHDESYFVAFDPMATPEHRIPLLIEYITWVFSSTSADKVWLQLEMPDRGRLLKSIPAPFRCCPIYYTLTWPIYDLMKFDVTLPGGRYKTLRKERNIFYQKHKVEVLPAAAFGDSESLHAVVEHWRKRRVHHDRGMTGVYHELINAKFKGMDEARVFVVDGRPAGFNAGWIIPNSKRFYGGVGIHDYSVDDLGTMLYLEDLVWLKSRGYAETDMGGTEKSALPFKNKFGPTSSYKAAIFSVAKK